MRDREIHYGLSAGSTTRFITHAGMSSHGPVRQPPLCPPNHYQQSSHPSLLLLGAPGAAEQLSGGAAASCVLMHLQIGSTTKTNFADSSWQQKPSNNAHDVTGMPTANRETLCLPAALGLPSLSLFLGGEAGLLVKSTRLSGWTDSLCRCADLVLVSASSLTGCVSAEVILNQGNVVILRPTRDGEAGASMHVSSKALRSPTICAACACTLGWGAWLADTCGLGS